MKIKIAQHMFVTIILACLLVPLLGCNPFSGTGTGNPNNVNQGFSTVADTLAQVSCSTINKCYGGDQKECADTVNELFTFAPKLGLTDLLSVHEISSRESLGVLVGNSEKAIVCIERLRSLSCLSGEVVTSPMDSAEMLDPICSEIF